MPDAETLAALAALEQRIASIAASELTPEQQRELVRSAIEKAAHRWLQETYATVGRWTVRGLVAAALVAIFVFLGQHGYRVEQLFLAP